MKRQLSDPSTYQLLTSNPSQSYNQDLHLLISTAGPSQGLSETDISLLLNSQPHTPCLYLLPKIHKPGNSGRPIVSSYDSPTEHVSAYIDAYLQPFVKSLPSHIQDTNHFLDKIRSQLTPLSHQISSCPLLKFPPYTPTCLTPMASLSYNISLINIHPIPYHPLSFLSN